MMRIADIQSSAGGAVVDLIVPVYRGLAETRRCLASVLAFPQRTPHEIVVIDDCSPEPELSTWLRELAWTGAITLLENPVNTGFVNAVNRGMILHSDRDVVLLNSDTEVHGDWLDRLHRCACGDPMTGAVTPFSNNATIFSYPRFMQDNPLPAGLTLATLDEVFAEVNQGLAIEVPTVVGFCMYIRRDCLNQVGYFDALIFKRGYGEENEFCLRATEVGFKHLLCADVFVYHQGSVSFGSETKALCAEAEQKILERYPHYLGLIGDYCTRDPGRILRRRVDTFRLVHSPRPKLLFVTHTWGGGTEKHIRDLVDILQSDFEVMILRPTGPGGGSIEWGRSGEEFVSYFSLPYAYSKLLDLIRSLGIARLHFHHVIGLNRQILQLPGDLRLPYDFTLHDYYPICPQYTLTRKDGRYCGEPDVEGCNVCLAERPALWGLDILSWRTLLGELLTGADRVIVPSRDILARLRGYVPDARYVWLPHPEPAPAAPLPSVRPSGELKILVLGRLTPAKGLYRLEACAVDARARDLPLFFRVIGHADCDVRQEPEIPLSFTGLYDDAELPLLMGRERPDLIFFPAQWPETYSYTLSYALGTGLPIIAPRLGAFIERLADYPRAWLLDWDAPVADCNDLFVSLLECGNTQKMPQRKPVMTPEDYLRRYAEPFQSLAGSGSTGDWQALVLDPDYYYPPHLDQGSGLDVLNRTDLLEILQRLLAAEYPQQRLSRAKVQEFSETFQRLKDEQAWRQTEMERLAAVLAQYQSDHDRIIAELVEHQSERQRLGAELDHCRNQAVMLRANLADLLASTSWGVTKPLRWLGRLVKAARASDG